MSSATEALKKGLAKPAATLNPATDKVAGTIKDTAHQAGKKMLEAGQRVKDVAE